MILRLLFLSLLLCGCGAQSKPKPEALGAHITGPFTDLDQNVFYKEGNWYKIELQNRTDTTFYIPVGSNSRQDFSPYSTAHFFSKDSITTSLSCGLSDSLIPLSPKAERSFFMDLRQLPHERTDSFLLFFRYYPDTSLYYPRALEVKCFAEAPPKLKVFSPQ